MKREVNRSLATAMEKLYSLAEGSGGGGQSEPIGIEVVDRRKMQLV